MPLSELIVPPVLPDLPDQVTDIQLARYAELIYVRTGICVSPQKKALLSNRLRRRLRSTGIEGFDAYYQRLKRLPPQDPEWDAFLQEITTHETYLFRDQAQWDWLRNVVPAEMGAARQSNGGRACLRIWSAACSTGDEAFTAACCVRPVRRDFANGTSRSWARTSASAPSNRPGPRSSASGPWDWSRHLSKELFHQGQERRSLAGQSGPDADGRFPAAQSLGAACGRNHSTWSF